MKAFVIDAFEFCRLNERREGELAVADLPRVMQESVDGSGTIDWSLGGGNDDQERPRMRLSVTGRVRLMCQRCLTPFSFEFASESVLALARDEAGADAIDALLDDESIEVIVGSKAFNVNELIEDEVLLTIPLSPKHETCPDQLVSGTSLEATPVSPFSVLKNLKQ